MDGRVGEILLTENCKIGECKLLEMLTELSWTTFGTIFVMLTASMKIHVEISTKYFMKSSLAESSRFTPKSKIKILEQSVMCRKMLVCKVQSVL